MFFFLNSYFVALGMAQMNNRASLSNAGHRILGHQLPHDRMYGNVQPPSGGKLSCTYTPWLIYLAFSKYIHVVYICVWNFSFLCYTYIHKSCCNKKKHFVIMKVTYLQIDVFMCLTIICYFFLITGCLTVTSAICQL